MAGTVIIGAGQSGFSTASSLRSQGYTGDITLVGAEDWAPYQRPPLSKAYLLGDMDDARMLLKPDSFYPQAAITLLTGTTATHIDPARNEVHAGGQVLRYDNLVLATGTIPRRLPVAIGGTLSGVFSLRSAADARSLGTALQPGRNLLVLGGGYVGLEVAAVAAKRGLRVTVVEASARILQRVAAPATSDYFRNLHLAHGVTILEGTGVDRLEGEAVVRRAVLTDGRTLDTDLVLVGIGVLPAIALAEQAGLALDNGIKVDSFGRTSVPAIWAVGDCCSFPYAEGRIRLESVPHALEQAAIVAGNILGNSRPYTARPWFWSDQYDVKLQIAGLNLGYDTVLTRAGAAAGQMSVWYYRDAQLLAVDSMNDARTFMIARKLLDQGLTAPPANVADPRFDLRDLLQPSIRSANMPGAIAST